MTVEAMDGAGFASTAKLVIIIEVTNKNGNKCSGEQRILKTYQKRPFWGDVKKW